MAREAANRFLNDREARQRDLEAVRHTARFARDVREQCRVLERVAKLSTDFGDLQREIESVDMLLNLADLLGDDYWRAVGHERSALHLWNSGRLAESSAENALAAELFERIAHDRGRLNAAFLASMAAGRAGNFECAADHIAAAAEIARSAEDPSMIATVARARAVVALAQHDFASAAAAANELLEMCRSIGDRKVEAVAHGLLGRMSALTWQIEDARQHFEFAREIGQAQIDKHGLAVVLLESAQRAADLGELDQGDDFATQAIALGEALGADAIREAGFVHLARIELLRGRPARSIRLSTQALELARTREAATALAMLAEAKAQLGELGDAIVLFEGAIPKLRHDGELDDEYSATLAAASAYLAAARLGDAERCVSELMRKMEPGTQSLPRQYRARVFWIAGRVLSATGDVEQAKTMFGRARLEFEELRNAIPDAETRDRFSALPYYREILAYCPS